MAKNDSYFPERFKNTRFKDWLVDNDNVIKEQPSNVTGLNDSLDVNFDTNEALDQEKPASKAQKTANPQAQGRTLSKTKGRKRGPKESRIMDGNREERTTAIKIMVKPGFSKKCKTFCAEKDMTIEELGYKAISEYISKFK